jgi:hypothetical protein
MLSLGPVVRGPLELLSTLNPESPSLQYHSRGCALSAYKNGVNTALKWARSTGWRHGRPPLEVRCPVFTLRQSFDCPLACAYNGHGPHARGYSFAHHGPEESPFRPRTTTYGHFSIPSVSVLGASKNAGKLGRHVVKSLTQGASEGSASTTKPLRTGRRPNPCVREQPGIATFRASESAPCARLDLRALIIALSAQWNRRLWPWP